MEGEDFDLEAMLDNLSARGLYLRLEHQVQKAAELSFLIRLPPGVGPGEPGMRVAASGIVRRVELRDDETFGVGVEFTRYRQLHN
jgi:hypothetical protein